MKDASLIELVFHLTPLLIRLLSREWKRKIAVLLRRITLERVSRAGSQLTCLFAFCKQTKLWLPREKCPE